MDPPGRGNGTFQRQDATISDFPVPQTERMYGNNPRNLLHVFPEVDEVDIYGSILDSAPSPTEAHSQALGHLLAYGEGGPDHRGVNGPSQVQVPIPAPRTRFSIAGLPTRQPPPVPPRRSQLLNNRQKRFSCDFTVPAIRLNRSNTEANNHVSICTGFPHGRDKRPFMAWMKRRHKGQRKCPAC